MYEANQVEQANSPNLTDKQRAFVLEYVKDWNATQAAIRAGYSEKTAMEQGYQLLQKPSVRQLVDMHLANMGITADRVLAEQAALAFSDLGDFVTIQAGGGVLVNDSEHLKGRTKLIRKIKEKRKILTKAEGDGEEMIIDSQLEIELYDKQKALDVLGKHTSGRERINAPKVEHQTDPTKQPAQQMVELMGHVLSQAQAGQIDPVVAKSLATLATALLKANEQGELEERIKALEAVQAGSTPDSFDLGF